jgi:hypothetical protein
LRSFAAKNSRTVEATVNDELVCRARACAERVEA